MDNSFLCQSLHSAAALLTTNILPDDLKDARKLKVASADKTVGFPDIVQEGNYSMPCYLFFLE